VWLVGSSACEYLLSLDFLDLKRFLYGVVDLEICLVLDM